jgi:hypothetical protein
MTLIKEENICYEDIKNKEREKTTRNKEKTQWRSIRCNEAATAFIQNK